MKKSIIVIGSIALTFIFVSYATAVPYSNSRPIIEKIEEIENKLSFDKIICNFKSIDIINNIRNNKIEDLKTLTANINDFHQTFEEYKTSAIGDLIGIFYIIVGLISLFFTVLMVMLACVAIIFNPMGFVYFLLALFPGILSIIFLGGGLSLLVSNNPLLNLEIIISLSFVLFITWIILKMNGISFIDIIIVFIIYILDFLSALFNNPTEQPASFVINGFVQ